MAGKQNYSYKTRRSDTLTTRMMIVFVLLIISVFALLSIKNWLGTTAAVDSYDVYMKAAPFFPVLPLVLTVAAAIYFIKSKLAKKDESLKIVSSGFLLSIAAVLLVVSLLISNYIYLGYVPAVIFVILVSLLYFIAVSFPGSYLIITVFNALGAFAIYALNLVSPIDHAVAYYAFRVIAIVLAIAFGVLIYLEKKRGSLFNGVRILKDDASCLPMFIAIAVFVLCMALGMLRIGSYVIYDVVIALETIIFALFYAIKMLK